MDLDLAVTNAMHRIEDLYNETDGKCYVSFSGGKDSTVILAIIKMCEDIYTIPKDSIPAVFANTGIEMGVTVDFVKWVKENWYTKLEIVRPEKSFDWVLKNKGKPIKSKVRAEFLHRYHSGNHSDSVMQNLVYGITRSGFPAQKTKLADKDMHMLHDDFPIHASPACCDYLKKKPFKAYSKQHGAKGYAVGIRASEGGARAMNAKSRAMKNGEQQKPCTTISGGYIKKAPIIDWDEETVNAFVEKYNVPLSRAYTEFGFQRTGCMACPFAPDVDANLKYLCYHEPNRYKAAMHWLKDVYIAQNVKLPFDEEYERERERMWKEVYEPMRQEMLRKYRPKSRLLKDDELTTIFDFLGDE